MSNGLPPLRGATHEQNFERYVANKAAGYEGSYANYIDSAGGSPWTVTYSPAAGGVAANTKPFLEAKSRGYGGSIGDFMRDGFSYTVSPAAGVAAPAEGVVPSSTADEPAKADATTRPGKRSSRPSWGVLFRIYLNLMRDIAPQNARAAASRAEVESRSTPTAKRAFVESSGAASSVAETLASTTGPERVRRRLMPELPNLPAMPQFKTAWAYDDLAAAVDALRQRMAALPNYIRAADGTLAEWSVPTERRRIEQHDDAKAGLAALLAET